jgi:hypothetical protein
LSQTCPRLNEVLWQNLGVLDIEFLGFVFSGVYLVENAYYMRTHITESITKMISLSNEAYKKLNNFKKPDGIFLRRNYANYR